MEKITLHFKFDIYSLSYGQFLTFVGDNGIPLSDRYLESVNHILSISVTIPNDIATIMRLKFGYFEYTPLESYFQPPYVPLISWDDVGKDDEDVEIEQRKESFIKKYLSWT